MCQKTGYHKRMAYTSLRDLVHLARELQATSLGLTINEIMERVAERKGKCSRKTAYRMLRGLYELDLEAKPKAFQLDSDHHSVKRWAIEGGLPAELLILDKTERSAVERHLETLPEGSGRVAISKLLAKSEPLGKHIATATGELIDRTGHINNIGPRLQIDPKKMAAFEEAILAFRRLKIKYRGSGKPKASWRTVEPLGLLFGRFGYLVANLPKTSMKPLTYRLDLIEEVKDADQVFEEPQNFNFKEWANESFGVFHGDELLNIKLRFSGDAAKRVEKIQFHPSQKISNISSNFLQIFGIFHQNVRFFVIFPLNFDEISLEFLRFLQKLS